MRAPPAELSARKCGRSGRATSRAAVRQPGAPETRVTLDWRAWGVRARTGGPLRPCARAWQGAVPLSLAVGGGSWFKVWVWRCPKRSRRHRGWRTSVLGAVGAIPRSAAMVGILRTMGAPRRETSRRRASRRSTSRRRMSNSTNESDVSTWFQTLRSSRQAPGRRIPPRRGCRRQASGLRWFPRRPVCFSVAIKDLPTQAGRCPALQRRDPWIAARVDIREDLESVAQDWLVRHPVELVAHPEKVVLRTKAEAVRL